MNNGHELIEALNQIEKEKGISKDILLEAMENSLVAACKNEYGKADNIRVNIDRETGNVVVYAEKEMAERLAIKYGAKNIFDYFELSEDTAICEIAVPDNWVGKTILQKSVRNKYNVSILATKKDGVIYANPSPDHIFDKHETLMVLANMADIDRLTR